MKLPEGKITLYKFLHTQGFGTKKEIRRLLMKGQVTVNDHEVNNEDTQVDLQSDIVVCGGKKVEYYANIYVVMNKPLGYEVSHKPEHHSSAFSLLPPEFIIRSVQAAGRLDENSTGLLLFSDDGQFIHKIISKNRKVTKTYRAVAEQDWNEDMLQKLREGVELRGEKGIFKALELCKTADREIEITIDSGIYHQVRRMAAAAGNRLSALHRFKIGGYDLGDLAPGQWKLLSAEDQEKIFIEGTP